MGRDVISSVLRVNDLRGWGVTIHLYVGSLYDKTITSKSRPLPGVAHIDFTYSETSILLDTQYQTYLFSTLSNLLLSMSNSLPLTYPKVFTVQPTSISFLRFLALF